MWCQRQVPRHRAPSVSFCCFCFPARPQVGGRASALHHESWQPLLSPQIRICRRSACKEVQICSMPGATLNSIHPTYSKLVGTSSIPAPSFSPFGNGVGTGGSAVVLGVEPQEGEEEMSPPHFHPCHWNFSHLHAFSVASCSDEASFPCWEYNNAVDVLFGLAFFSACVSGSHCNLLTLRMGDVVRLPGTVVL